MHLTRVISVTAAFDGKLEGEVGRAGAGAKPKGSQSSRLPELSTLLSNTPYTPYATWQCLAVPDDDGMCVRVCLSAVQAVCVDGYKAFFKYQNIKMRSTLRQLILDNPAGIDTKMCEQVCSVKRQQPSRPDAQVLQYSRRPCA